MKRKPILTALAFALVLMTACKNSGVTDGLPIPADAGMVVHINTASLTSKLSWKEIQQSNWFKELSEKESDTLYKKLLENPETSGVDLSSDFVFFTRQRGNGGYMVFEGRIKDATAFANMVKNINKNATPAKDGDLNYISTGEDGIVTWTDSRFMAVSDAPMYRAASPWGMQQQGTQQQRFSQDSLRGFSKELLSLKNDASLEKDKRFKDLAGSNGDVHVWIGSTPFTSMAGGMMSMLKVNTLLEGNVITYTLDFQDGKIAVNGKGYLNDALKNLFEKYPPKDIDASVINRIPSDNVTGAMVYNINPDALKEVLRMGGLDGMANGMLGQMNYSLDELIRAMGGNLVYAFTDLAMKDTTYPYSQEPQSRPTGSFLFATSVRDRASFEKLMGIVREKMFPGKPMPVNFAVNDQWFVLSDDSTKVQGFLAGGNHHVSFADKISGHPFGMYIDIQKAMTTIGSMKMQNAYDSLSFAANKEMWQDAMGSGGEMKDGVITFDFTLNLVNKSENSLKQINQYAEKMAAARKLRPQPQYQMDLETMPDSMEVPPIVEEN